MGSVRARGAGPHVLRGLAGVEIGDREDNGGDTDELNLNDPRDGLDASSYTKRRSLR